MQLNIGGPPSLSKIAGTLGTLIKADRATTERALLSYARVLVEVSIKKELPDVIEFIDEYGHKVLQEVNYEWKPILCQNCGGMGHDTEKCKRLLGVRGEWVRKEPQPTVAQSMDNDGFQTPKNT